MPESYARLYKPVLQQVVAKANRSLLVYFQGIQALRDNLDNDPESKTRNLVVTVDGAYTNREVYKSTPKHTVIIGRIRKDAQFFGKSEKREQGRGRKRLYGEKLPTPEAVRQDEEIPWQQIVAYAAGSQSMFGVKIVKGVRWKPAGGCNLANGHSSCRLQTNKGEQNAVP